MMYLQFKYYLDNEDMASMSYRIFNHEEQDEYPSFSICFVGFRGEIFNQSHDVFTSNNVTRASYREYLRGEKKDYLAQFTTVEFDDVVSKVYDRVLMQSWGFCDPYGTYWPIDMIPTFRSPDEICVSKNTVHRKNAKQRVDYIKLNSSML